MKLKFKLTVSFLYSGPPNLLDNQQIVVVEGTTRTINLRQAPDAFPFPQQFSWTTNNNSRVTFGYTSVTFLPFIREDTGTYNLTATNYRLDDTSVVVGTDTGSFTLDVQCKSIWFSLVPKLLAGFQYSKSGRRHDTCILPHIR